jgi:hypothetical protein
MYSNVPIGRQVFNIWCDRQEDIQCQVRTDGQKHSTNSVSEADIQYPVTQTGKYTVQIQTGWQTYCIKLARQVNIQSKPSPPTGRKTPPSQTYNTNRCRQTYVHYQVREAGRHTIAMRTGRRQTLPQVGRLQCQLRQKAYIQYHVRRPCRHAFPN